MGIVHIQCLLRIASVLADVFLTSSFCVVPESSGSSNAASSSLFVHVELGTRTALVQLIALSQQCTASFKDLHTIGGSRRHWRLFSSIDPYTVVSNQFRLQLLTVKLLLNDVLVCDLCGDSVQRVFGEPNSSPHVMIGGFISLHAKPHSALDLGFMRLLALLGLLHPCCLNLLEAL